MGVPLGTAGGAQQKAEEASEGGPGGRRAGSCCEGGRGRADAHAGLGREAARHAPCGRRPPACKARHPQGAPVSARCHPPVVYINVLLCMLWCWRPATVYCAVHCPKNQHASLRHQSVAFTRTCTPGRWKHTDICPCIVLFVPPNPCICANIACNRPLQPRERRLRRQRRRPRQRQM